MSLTRSAPIRHLAFIRDSLHCSRKCVSVGNFYHYQDSIQHLQQRQQSRQHNYYISLPLSKRCHSTARISGSHPANMASSEAGPSRPRAQAYPQRTFQTQLLQTDDEPVHFTDSSLQPPSCPSPSSSAQEPYRRASISSLGPPYSSSSSSAQEPYRRASISSLGPITSDSLSIASSHLHSSLPVAFPTETVYGLAGNALCEMACKAIFDAKGRPQDNPLIVHVCDLEMAQGVTSRGWTAPRVYETLMKRFWPGGITFLVPAARDAMDSKTRSEGQVNGHTTTSSSFFVGSGSLPLPMLVTANHPLVGIRMPSHPLARALIAHSRLPLAAPSANASGRPSPTTAQHVMYDLGGGLDASRSGRFQGEGRIPCVLDGGPSNQGVESTVVDGVTCPSELRVLRPGAVGIEEIAECLSAHGLLISDSDAAKGADTSAVHLRVYGKDMARQTAMEANPTTPGMKYRHYSPTAPVVLFENSATSPDSNSKAKTHWKEALEKEVDSLLSTNAKDTQGKKLKVGFMTLLDSPLSRTIFSTLPSTSAGVVWRGAQMSLPDSYISSRQSNGQTELPSNPLGPSFALPLSSTDVDMVPFSLGTTTQPHLAAQRLFSGLRLLDEGPLQSGETAGESTEKGGSRGEDGGGVDLIIVEAVSDTGVGLAVMNRVAKAAAGRWVVGV